MMELTRGCVLKILSVPFAVKISKNSILLNCEAPGSYLLF